MLRSFARRSLGFDVAIVHSTGHGVEIGDRVYVLPGDYPFREGRDAASPRRHAVSVRSIASACGAGKLNVTFLAGCRVRPRAEAGR